MTAKPPCAWIADKLVCGKPACDKRGPCDGFEVSKGAIAGEAIRKRRAELREMRAIGHHNLVMASVIASLHRRRNAYPYDEKCAELAAHFLSDVAATDEQRQELAIDIQKLCEDFCVVLERDKLKQSSENTEAETPGPHSAGR